MLSMYARLVFEICGAIVSPTLPYTVPGTVPLYALVRPACSFRFFLRRDAPVIRLFCFTSTLACRCCIRLISFVSQRPRHRRLLRCAYGSRSVWGRVGGEGGGRGVVLVQPLVGSGSVFLDGGHRPRADGGGQYQYYSSSTTGTSMMPVSPPLPSTSVVVSQSRNCQACRLGCYLWCVCSVCVVLFRNQVRLSSRWLTCSYF